MLLSGATKVKSRLRAIWHRGDFPMLMKMLAKGYAYAHWSHQRWLLRTYKRQEWLPIRHDPEQVVDFAFNGYDGAFAPIQSRHELLELARLVRSSEPTVVLEVGTARGGTFFVLTQMAQKNATLVSVDLPGGIGGSGYPAWKEPILCSFATGEQSVHLIRADSHDPQTLTRVRTALRGQRVDLLFIDGDHSYDGVKADFEMYSPLVRPGGLICVHDVVPNPHNSAIEVDEFWAEIGGSPDATVIRDPASLPGFGIGVVVK
ncbi:MAG: class I SAM-dependent methyltransferase [Pseudonocardiaceae bacterium]